MKKYFLACLLGIFSLSAWAQNDAGRLSISAVQPEYENIPEEARANLETKMQRLLSACGLVSTEADRFIMTARVDITAREVNTAGMIVQRMDITFIIGDVVEEKIYATSTIHTWGIGETETKCYIQAFKNIQVNNPDLVALVNDTKDEIISYYTDNCTFLLQEAERLATMQQYERAIANLVTVPAVCADCYTTCQNKAVEIYKQYINLEGKKLIQNARSAWLAHRDYDSATEALRILAKVNPEAQCQTQANALIKEINTQLRRIEAAQAAAAKAEWEFKVKQYEDKMELERQKQEGWNTLANRFGRIDIGYKRERAFKFGSSSK